MLIRETAPTCVPCEQGKSVPHDGLHREDWGKMSFGGTGHAFGDPGRFLHKKRAEGAKFGASS